MRGRGTGCGTTPRLSCCKWSACILSSAWPFPRWLKARPAAKQAGFLPLFGSAFLLGKRSGRPFLGSDQFRLGGTFPSYSLADRMELALKIISLARAPVGTITGSRSSCGKFFPARLANALDSHIHFALRFNTPEGKQRGKTLFFAIAPLARERSMAINPGLTVPADVRLCLSSPKPALVLCMAIQNHYTEY